MTYGHMRFSALLTITLIAILAFGAVCFAAGARFNSTKSIPLGLYWTSRQPLSKGAYVLFCPPKTSVFEVAKERNYISAGFCASGYGYMMKRVFATKGDTVSITDEGVMVNDSLLPFSKPLRVDKAGRSLPIYRINNFLLNESDLLLMSDITGSSFDSRYFGVINRSQIKTVIVPVFTW